MGYAPENWRDPANYPSRQSTTMRRWAGEFLIRNPEFQAALRALHRLWPRRRGKRYQVTARHVANRFGLTHWGFVLFRGDEPLIYPSFRVAPYSLSSDVHLKGAPGKWFLGEDEGWGAALVFDLRKLIAPQLRVAGELLKASARADLERRALRDRQADYQAMLRVLDARAMRVSWMELAQAQYLAALTAARLEAQRRRDE
jgi:hypothetical protein